MDSGSTTTFVPTEIAEILGYKLDTEHMEPAVGAGGEFSTGIFQVTIETLKGGNPIAEFKDWKTLVPSNPNAIPYVILGRDSIFMKFDITFRERMRRTILRPPKVKLKHSRFDRRY
jgi:hypothetical protein